MPTIRSFEIPTIMKHGLGAVTALGDEASVDSCPLGKVLAEKIRENDINGNDATSGSFFRETCIKFWCSLPAMPPYRSDEQSGKQ